MAWWQCNLGSVEHVKESNPVDVAEYAIANKIAEEPACSWWVQNVLRKRNRMISQGQTLGKELQVWH